MSSISSTSSLICCDGLGKKSSTWASKKARVLGGANEVNIGSLSTFLVLADSIFGLAMLVVARIIFGIDGLWGSCILPDASLSGLRLPSTVTGSFSIGTDLVKSLALWESFASAIFEAGLAGSPTGSFVAANAAEFA